MNIDTLRLPGNKTTMAVSVKKTVQPYLRGPIPWSWLHAAIKLPGSAVEVGLALWHFRAVKKSLTFKTGIGDIAAFLGVSTATVRRAIDALQLAGLIERECLEGRKCLITMVEAPIVLDLGVAVPGTPMELVLAEPEGDPDPTRPGVSGANDDPDPIDNSHGYAIEVLPDDADDPVRLIDEIDSNASPEEYDDGPPPEDM